MRAKDGPDRARSFPVGQDEARGKVAVLTGRSCPQAKTRAGAKSLGTAAGTHELPISYPRTPSPRKVKRVLPSGTFSPSKSPIRKDLPISGPKTPSPRRLKRVLPSGEFHGERSAPRTPPTSNRNPRSH